MANGDDGNLFDPYGLERLLEVVQEIRDRGVVLNTDKMSAPLKEVVDSLYKKVQQGVQNRGKIDPKEIKPLVDSIINTLRDTGMATKGLMGYSKELRTVLEKLAEKGDLDEDKLVHMFVASISNMFKTGIMDPNKKTAKDDYTSKLIAAAFSDKQVKAINSLRDAVMYIWGQQQGQEKTKKRQFIEDLVTGLSQSKFFGGAIMDFVKLVIYMVGSWLKDKGPLGKALTVALVAGAPVIATAIARAIIGGMAKLFTGMFTTLIVTPLKWALGRVVAGIRLGVSKIVTAIQLGSLAGGARALGGGKVTSIKAGSTVATINAARSEELLARATGATLKPTPVPGSVLGNVGKGVLSLGKGAARLAAGGAIYAGVGLAADWGANKAVESGIDPRLAHGASGAVQGAMFGAMFGPIGAAIGGAIGGIAGLIKGHYEKQESLGEDQLKELKEQKKWKPGWKLGFGGDESEGSQGSSQDQISSSSASNLGVQSSISSNDLNSFQGRRVTGRFQELRDYHGVSKEHQGIDLDYKQGENVGAFVGGKVIFAGMGTNANHRKGYGNVVDIQDSLGFVHRYAHLSNINVKEGQEVSAKDIIGLAGATGGDYDPHLHYGLTNKLADGLEKWIDPRTIEAEWYKKALAKSEKKDPKLISAIKSYSNWWTNGAWLGSLPIAKYSTEMYEAAKQEAEQKLSANKTSIAPSDNPDEIAFSNKAEDQEQWDRINRNRSHWTELDKKIKEQKEEVTVPVIPPQQEMKLDFTGTEKFSRVLQSTLDAQQQAYKQF